MWVFGPVSTLGIVLLIGLATSRLTRLWRDDTVAEPIRDRVNGWLDRGVIKGGRLSGVWGWLYDLLSCPWCISGWIAAAAVIVIDSATSRSLDLPVLVWLASWQVACLAYWLNELVFDSDQGVWHHGAGKGWWQ